MDRRDLLKAAMAASWVGALPLSGRAQAAAGADPLILFYDRPATEWVEALPIGNGRLGAMVFGGVAQERLQLNEDSLWAGGPYDPINPEARANLDEVRRLILAGEYQAAHDLTNQKLMAKPLRQMPYGTAGDLLIELAGQGEITQFSRQLDLRTAITKSQFRRGRQTITREAFAHGPMGVLVQHWTSNSGAMDLSLSYRHPAPAHYGQERFTPNDIAAERAVDHGPKPPEYDKKWPPHSSKPNWLNIRSDGANAITIEGRNEPAEGIEAALRFAIRVLVQTDGRIMVDGETIHLTGARRATFIVDIATSYVGFGDISGDPVARVRARTQAVGRQNYRALRQTHIRDHQARFDSFDIGLDGPSSGGNSGPSSGPILGQTTDQQIAQSLGRDDPKLAQYYVQYGRYLLLSSSRAGSQPANLQGIWNEGTNPPWGSKYTININTEMNYWPAGPANMLDCYVPLLKMVSELAQSGRNTAQTMYGARGWVAHHNTDLWRASAPIDGASWGIWPLGGAWLCNSLWDYYEYGQSAAVLAQLYPLMRDAALFFIDTMVEDPQGRGLVTVPSISPENTHPAGVSICAGPAMDRQIIRDLFYNVMAAYQLLDAPEADGASIDAITAALAKIPPDKIGAQGQLQEWLDDWDGAAPEQQHRHVSHLYGLYPSSQINVKDTPELVAAAKVTLANRGDLATGWGTAWRLCLWARMGQGEHAYQILKGLLGPARTYPNMFDAHPPFQIDGNFGGTAGILEMLVQSWGDQILLLPALPNAWAKGFVRGLLCRGGISVDVNWANHQLVSAQFTGPAWAVIHLAYQDQKQTIQLGQNGKYLFRPT